MAREIDVRETRSRGATPPPDGERRMQLERAAAEVTEDLPGAHTIDIASFDAVTGNAAVVVSTGARARPGNYVTRALQHVQRVSRAIGLEPGQAAEFVADPDFQTTSTGAVAVHLRQQYKGIAIYDGAETVRFDPDGRLLEVAGRSFTVAMDLPVTSALSAGDALRVAATWVATADPDPGRDPFGQSLADPPLDLTGFAPTVRTVGADKPERPVVFDAPPFEHAVTVSLLWFPLASGLRLAWHTRLDVPGGGSYRVVVDANDGRVLLCRALARSILGRGQVVLRSGQARQEVNFPLPIAGYGAPVPGGLPTGFPDPWLTGASTDGATVRAVNAATGATVAGSTSSGEVVFPAGDATGPDQLVLNVFALCGAMHDVLYLLGFREADGNFQSDNRGRGGRQSDPVFARVHPGAVWGTANMATPADGSRPTMNMGLVTSTNRHTALDPDVVYHEYTHGLTNRLVGGPMNDTALDADQSAGMGEGWSDFVACIVLAKTVVGDWVVNNPMGIRRRRYDEAFGDTYADLGTSSYSQVHDIGELWCATLMSLARRIGAWVAAQVVVDALKLTAANPSFLAARDAILLAAGQYATGRGDTDAERDEFVHAVWQTFASFGMGPGAQTDGATLGGIVADFETPPPTSGSAVRGSVAPNLGIPDDDADGVWSTIPLPAAGHVTELAVTVDIAHPYRGDLVVRLVAPTGTEVVLHDRGGGSANDIHQTWSSTSSAPLAALHGTPVQGGWTLVVADHAGRDVGVLVSWAIEATVGDVRPAVEHDVVVGVAIPDDDPEGVTSTVDVGVSGAARSVQLGVDITHTYIGDLQVALLGPTGKRVVVHRRRGGSADNLITTYGSLEGQPLAPFVGLDPSGTWTLTVADREGQDVGKLNRWRLAIET